MQKIQGDTEREIDVDDHLVSILGDAEREK